MALHTLGAIIRQEDPMSDPRLHHYIPRFYLERFADPQSTQSEKKAILWVYERGREIRKSTPEKEARQRDFYAFKDAGERQQDIENALATIESMVAPVLEKVADSDYFPEEEDRGVVATFIALMFTRVPSHREFTNREFGRFMTGWLQEDARNEEKFDTEYAKFQQEMGPPDLTAEEMRRFILDGDYEIEQKSAAFDLNLMMKASADIAPVIYGYGWQIWHAERGELFLTSDNPVVTSLPGPGWMKFGLGFGIRGVEVVFPLGSTVCLFMKVGAKEGIVSVGNRSVRDINKRLIMCARRFLYGGEHSRKIAEVFERHGGQVIYGETAFLPPDSLKLRNVP